MERDHCTVTLRITESGLSKSEVFGRIASQIAVLTLQHCVLLKLALISTAGSELKCNNNFKFKYVNLTAVCCIKMIVTI